MSSGPGHIRPARVRAQIDLLTGELPGPYTATAKVRGRPNPYLGSSPHFHRSGLSGRDVSLIVAESDWHNVWFDWVDGPHQHMKITLDIIKVRITNFCKDRCWRTRFRKASLDHVSAMFHAGLYMTRSVPNVCQHIRNHGAAQQLQSSLSSRPPEEPIIDPYPPTERKPGMPNPAASRDSKRGARGVSLRRRRPRSELRTGKTSGHVNCCRPGPTRAIAGCTLNPGSSSPPHRSLGTHGCLTFALEGCLARGLKVHPPMARPSRPPPSKLHFFEGGRRGVTCWLHEFGFFLQ